MIRRILTLSLVLTALILNVSEAATVPPGAFLTRPVSGVADLCDLVSRDGVTAKRFAAHFGVKREALPAYFRENLRFTTLSAPGSYTMYFVTKSGSIHSRKAQLAVGEKVFVTLDGRPVIAARCGNPLTKHLPKPVQKAVTQPKSTEAMPSIEAAIAGSYEESAVETTQTANAMIAEPLIPEADKVAGIQMELAPSRTRNFGFLAAAASLGAAGSVTINTNHEDGTRQPPVPEPSSLAAFGLFGIGYITRKLTSRRR